MAFIALNMDDILYTSLQQGITPAIIVAIYLLIVKIIDVRREHRQTKLSNDLIESINKISVFLDDVTSNIINKEKEKCKIAIEDSMFAAAHRITDFISSTIVNNHIDANKDIIISNIHNTIYAEFYNIRTTLSLYKYNGVRPASYINLEWAKLTEDDAINTIYNNKLNKEDRIISFTKRVNIAFQTYITDILVHINK